MVQLFQQDGVTAKITATFLQDLFGNDIFEHDVWPLSPITYTTLLLSVGFINERVYSSNPRSVDNIKHNVDQVVADSDEENL
jgi:hypothetical protein